jgi:predicted MFS family arabinose efflux permease
MFDRFAITHLSPFIMSDLNMSNTDLGLIMSVFSLAWAFSGFFGSVLSDVTANKKNLLAIFALLSSVFAFLTGLATSFVMLMAIRFLMGMLEGPTFPLTQAFALAQSTPKRRGLNMGLISTTSMGVIANLLAPILLVALCQAVGWRITFFLTFVPGAIVAYLIYIVLKEPDMTKIEGAMSRVEKASLKDSLVIFKNRNLITSMMFSSFIISWNVGILTFAPLFLINVKGFSPVIMSYIMAAFGVGAVIWGILVPSLSDRLGRKPIIIIFTFLSIISPLGLILSSSAVVVALCALAGWSGSGVFALYQAAILGESVDTKYASTAMASVQMTGEIGGCVIGVAVAGKLADMFGLQAPMIFAACCLLIATFIAFFYYETAPIIVAKRN